MADFLLELYSEEIPAGMQVPGLSNLLRLFSQAMKEAGAEMSEPRGYVAAQRLALIVDDIPTHTPERHEVKKGPKIDAPEKAIEGFLRANGLTSVDQLSVNEHPKGNFYSHDIYVAGQDMSLVLARVIPEIIQNFPWPKSMRWGGGTLKWVRPLRNILCRLDGNIVPFEVGGMVSSGHSYGHRFLDPAAIEISHSGDYVGVLEAHKVIVDQAIREAMIAEGSAALAKKHGYDLIEDTALIRETAGLVEWPVPVLGNIDHAFMAVPDEVLTSVMRTHQKYFSLHNPDTGRLAPAFITISNMQMDDGGAAIAAGNERVLRARLSDGQFFWDQDRKTKLEDRVARLDAITFHAKLGTVGDKVARLEALAAELAVPFHAPADKAARAALLSKADLVSDMVFEFPELQGIMGGYYAIHDQEDESVARAIASHYAPLGPGDAIPDQVLGCVVALADKIDTLTGFWLIDEKPTGSKDPFALRRAALGVIRILLEMQISVSLTTVFLSAMRRHHGAGQGSLDAEDYEALCQDLLSFVMDRLQVYLRDQGIRYDVVAASMRAGADDVVDVVARGRALMRFVDTDAGANLLAAYNRADGICQKAKLDVNEIASGSVRAVDPDLFELDAERDLFSAMQSLISQGEDARLRETESFNLFLQALSNLAAPVDQFFDKVMVNVDDKAVRDNRLAILSNLVFLMRKTGDLSRIVKG